MSCLLLLLNNVFIGSLFVPQHQSLFPVCFGVYACSNCTGLQCECMR
jgi:hypothetical protein